MDTSEKSGVFFHGFADTFDTFYDGKRNPMMQWIDRRFRNCIFERYRLTFERLGDMRGKTVIDIGCGSGPYIVEAIKQGATHVAAVDAAPRMLELAKQRIERINALNQVSFHKGYFPQHKPEGMFDFAIVMGVLDYVQDAVSFLTGLRGVVHRAAVLSFPSKHWFRTPFRKCRYKLRDCPVYFYDEKLIDSLCRQTGWGIVDIDKIPGAGMDYFVCLKP